MAGDRSTRLRKSRHVYSPLFVWSNPAKVVGRNGHVINVASEIWKLNCAAGEVWLNWTKVNTASDVKDALKAYLAHIIEAKETGTAKTTFDHLKYVLCELLTLRSLDDLNLDVLEGALEKLRVTCTAWRFGYVRRWYRWCNDQEIPGFNDELEKRLYQFRISPNISGHVVMTRDPERGPFSDQELWLIRQALKEEKGSLLDRVCIALLLELGSRPTQMVLLEEQDFRIIDGFYSVDVPRIKQQTIGNHVKKRRRISARLGEAISRLIEDNHQQFGDYGQEMPLLCGYQPKRPVEVNSSGHRQILRMTRDSFKNRLVAYAHKAKIISPRTGKILNLFPYRFRYTFGTRHADQGTPRAIISELLDHDHLASVDVYFKSTNNMVERLNDALENNDHYTNIMKRFIGQVVSHTNDENPQRLIHGSTPTLKNLGGIGSCGADFLCKLMPPLSCYICPKFQAWTNGPHKEMLEELEMHVQHLVNRAGNSSDRIPHQLTEVITAIKALLLTLKEREGESKETGQQN